LAVGLFYLQNKSELIIRYDIKTANMMIIGMILVAVLALIVINIFCIARYLKKYKIKHPPKPKSTLISVDADVNSERYIRGKIEYFLGIRPKLQDELNKCLKQMDSIKEKQASLKEVRVRNDAAFLHNVAESLDKAELSIWDNTKAIINIAEIWDEQEGKDDSWKDVFDEQRKSIMNRIGLSDDLLKQSSMLLTKGTTFANDKVSTDEAKVDLESTMEVIEQLRGKSRIL